MRLALLVLPRSGLLEDKAAFLREPDNNDLDGSGAPARRDLLSGREKARQCTRRHEGVDLGAGRLAKCPEEGSQVAPSGGRVSESRCRCPQLSSVACGASRVLPLTSIHWPKRGAHDFLRLIGQATG